MEKYRMVYQNGSIDDFEAINDKVAKSKVNNRNYQGDIVLYKYSELKSTFDKWEYIGIKNFRGVKVYYEWDDADSSNSSNMTCTA
ncbi:MAG: hypothetical protein K0R49_73 [Burkholderiales bacterium]|jgi:hypothetical protein|nr:hypothetical protein [Burkholderiales bacterium]